MATRELNLRVPVGTKNKYVFILDIIGSISSPFNQLRNKERELFSWFLHYNDKYDSIPLEDRYALIISKKKEISDLMEISVDNFYNIVMNLKKKKLLLESGINPRYIIGNIDKITFTLNYDVK